MVQPVADPERTTAPAPSPALRVPLEPADIAVGLLLLALSACFWFGAGEIDAFTGPGVGPSHFPKGLAALLGAAVLSLVAGAAWRIWAGRSRNQVVVERPFHVLIGMALLVAFPALMERVGYYPAMAAFLAAFLWLADCRRPIVIAACVIGFLAFTKVVFETVLMTPIP